MGKLKRHFARICAKGNLQKQRKFRRDAEETQQIKELRNSRALPVKKKSRRFVRKDLAQNVQSRFYQEEHLVRTEVHTEVNDNNPALDVLIVSEQEQPEVHSSRIHGKVKNLSSMELTETKLSVLELGPKFCPVEHDINRARYQKDLNEGFRRMKLKAKFYPDEDFRTEEEKRFYVKSDWEPPNPNHAVRTYEMLIQSKFDVWKQPTRVARNLSHAQIQALKELKNDDNIDIKLEEAS